MLACYFIVVSSSALFAKGTELVQLFKAAPPVQVYQEETSFDESSTDSFIPPYMDRNVHYQQLHL